MPSVITGHRSELAPLGISINVGLSINRKDTPLV